MNLTIVTKTDRASTLNTTDIGASAVLKIYTTAPPATVETAQAGTVLATFTCASGSFGTVTSGVLTANTIPAVVIATSGTAAGARLFKNDGTTAVADFSVSATGGGGDIQFPTVTFTSAVTAQITAFTVTEQ